jgi:hypothetical protein
MKNATLTGAYNEYGYVIYQDGRAIYAAGNSPSDSQVYIGVEEREPEFFYHLPLDEDVDVLSLETIKLYCEGSLNEAYEFPDRYKLRGDHILGAVRYAPRMIPIGMAYDCGALTR